MAIASSGAVSVGNAAGSDRSINEELGITHNTTNSSMTTVVTAAVTGSTPRGSGTVTEARPHAFSEWHSYIHTQDFGTPTYYVRQGTGTSDFCVQNSMSITDRESSAVSNTVFYFKLNGTVVEFYMDIDHTKQYTPLFGETSISRTAHWRNTSGTSQSFSGSFSSGFTPVKIAELETGSVSGRQAKITASVFSGTGTYDSAVSGYTIGNGGTSSTDWRTPDANTLYGVAPAAWTLITGCFSQSVRNPFHRIVCEVKATGYNVKTLNTLVADHYAAAVSDGCV